MAALMTDDELRRAALTVLKDELGPVEALRFLALVRREPFDYESWRDETFLNLTAEDLFQKLETIEAGQARRSE